MHLDVVELRSFYYTTQLGRMVQRMVRARLRAMWPDIHGYNLVGFGFAAPFLRPFMEEAARTLCLMPAQQGVCPWPPEGPNVTALVEETLWPVPSGFVDRLIVAHGLESCERPAALFEEIWRVLAPGGKAIFLVPNRAGIWARRHRRFWLKVAPAIERIGQRVDAQRLAGVVMVEATKLVYIAPHTGAKLAAREPLRVLEGLRPKPKPATGRGAARKTT
jgi:SAM-dependent methyltransferase